jgi:hypothetical protein
MPFDVELSDPAAEDLSEIGRRVSIDAACFLQNLFETISRNARSESAPVRLPYPVAPNGRIREEFYEDEVASCIFVVLFELRMDQVMFVTNIGYRIYRHRI